MRSSLKTLSIVFALIITLIPYKLVADSFNFSFDILLMLAVLSLQLVAARMLLLTKQHTRSKSLTLFWQYILLALVGAFVATIAKSVYPNALLFHDFLSLFSYFFILLAIETNPHLNETPVNQYLGGRVPAIIFSVISFCYFILLPYEFSPKQYYSQLPSTLFNLSITGLISFRLLLNMLRCQQNYWRKIYGFLAIAGITMFIETVFNYQANYSQQVPGSFGESVSALLPYLTLLLASTSALKLQAPTQPERFTIHSELYILLLVITCLLIHFAGIEYQWFYIVSPFWQSVVLLAWTAIAVVFVSLLTYKKQQSYHQLKENYLKQAHKNEHLTKKNQQLTDTLVNNENKAIVYASNNAILTTSTTGKILSANPAAVQVFQMLEQDIIGLNIKHLFSAEDKMHYFFEFKSNVYALQRKEQGISVECNAIRSDQSEFPVQVELQWADSSDNALIVVTFINLTARKLAEKQTLELKDKFIANISHEFRTPLTIINGILDRYLKKSTNSDESQELTTAKRNGLRLVRMVEQLLELSRLSDNPELSLSTYRLKTLMAMPCDSFDRLANQSQLSFKAHIPDDLWLECDAQAFEKIIFNLLANAIKYTPEGGKISVNAYVEQETIILDIIDTGIGIDKSSQAKIFERFQRANDEKNQAIFGVGIGLSLVNELVKAHHWRINLVSEYNQGSKFSLSIPLTEPLTLEQHLPQSISEEELSSLLVESNTLQVSEKSHSQQVVLVIEDNLDMQSHIKQVIEQAHHCLLASSGELGLSLAQEYLPDLIVCDIMLTGIDGFEVLKQLKENELTAHIPIILLTARSDLDSRLQGLNLHADDYLSKPFNQQELLVRIANLMENRKQLQQSYLNKFNKIQVDERKDASHDKVANLTTSQSIAPVDEQFLTKLEKAIASMYTEPELGITDLASHMAISERQLQRKLKVLLGTTPNNFIKEFRLKKAQELLQSGAQIGRIALDVGFSSQTYFGRCFKESYQCTPKQYQQKFEQHHKVTKE
ncbi:ATP-binding protein [Thalassotalea sp. G2M2-11]|uniref:ATP-binding protein n=1 Tax=Thalassotalea sp. G2M2-11 TaxID=2787627 RepID=UPI001F49E362|nr:ATP-binding protein [Thalassotalea sp. G2M2-11]